MCAAQRISRRRSVSGEGSIREWPPGHRSWVSGASSPGCAESRRPGDSDAAFPEPRPAFLVEARTRWTVPAADPARFHRYVAWYLRVVPVRLLEPRREYPACARCRQLITGGAVRGVQDGGSSVAQGGRCVGAVVWGLRSGRPVADVRHGLAVQGIDPAGLDAMIGDRQDPGGVSSLARVVGWDPGAGVRAGAATVWGGAWWLL